MHQNDQKAGICCEVDDKAMVKNRYNQISQPPSNGKEIQTIKTTKSTTAQAKSHDDISFLADGQQAIFNKKKNSAKVDIEPT